eukprot:797894-Pyramimonas_sp.AAC.1
MFAESALTFLTKLPLLQSVATWCDIIIYCVYRSCRGSWTDRNGSDPKRCVSDLHRVVHSAYR